MSAKGLLMRAGHVNMCLVDHHVINSLSLLTQFTNASIESPLCAVIAGEQSAQRINEAEWRFVIWLWENDDYKF